MFLFYFNFKNAIRFSIFLPLFGNVSWKSRCVRQEFGEENLYSQIELLTVWSIETKLKINFLISSYTVEQRQIFQRLESSLRRVGTKDFWLEFKTKYKFNKYVSNTPGYNKLTIRSSCGGQLSDPTLCSVVFGSTNRIGAYAAGSLRFQNLLNYKLIWSLNSLHLSLIRFGSNLLNCYFRFTWVIILTNSDALRASV